MESKNNRQPLMTLIGSGVAFAGISYAVYKLLRRNNQKTDIKVSLPLTTPGKDDDATNTNLSPDEILYLLKETVSNFPFFLSRKRRDFRVNRRGVLEKQGRDEYIKTIKEFLETYPDSESIVRENLFQVLRRQNITREDFLNLVRTYENDTRVKQVLSTLEYDFDFDSFPACPQKLTEEKLVEILKEKLAALKEMDPVEQTIDMLVAEIEMADANLAKHKFEEDAIFAASLKHRSPELTKLKEEIYQEATRITPVEQLPDFSFA